MKNNYWFRKKKYGWGWVPNSWQGWLVIFLWTASFGLTTGNLVSMYGRTYMGECPNIQRLILKKGECVEKPWECTALSVQCPSVGIGRPTHTFKLNIQGVIMHGIVPYGAELAILILAVRKKGENSRPFKLWK